MAALPACVGSEITPVNGAQLQELPAGCPVREFPSTAPDYAWTDIATTRARCHGYAGRTACIEQIRKDVCAAGGDTAYGYKDGVAGEYTIVIATIARRTGAAAQAKAPGAEASPASDSCDPPCSPGYRCQAAACVALCNPACGAAMHCAQDRTCQPDAAPAPKAAAAAASPTKP